MEAIPAKPIEKTAVRVLSFELNSLLFNFELHNAALNIRASNEGTHKLFTGKFTLNDFSEVEKAIFVKLESIISTIEESLHKKRKFVFDDVGLLKVPYVLRTNEQSSTERVLDLKLAAASIGESQSLLMKIDRLENEAKSLKEANKQLAEQMILCRVPVSDQFDKIVPQIDLGTMSRDKATINGTEITSNKGIAGWYPFFLSNKIEGKMWFQLEFIDVGEYEFVVGVATQDLRNTPCIAGKPGAILIVCYADRTLIFNEQKSKQVPHRVPQNGDRVTVWIDRTTETVEWQTGFTYRIRIPERMRDKPLFPMIQLGCHRKNKVRFV